MSEDPELFLHRDVFADIANPKKLKKAINGINSKKDKYIYWRKSHPEINKLKVKSVMHIRRYQPIQGNIYGRSASTQLNLRFRRIDPFLRDFENSGKKCLKKYHYSFPAI